MTKMQFIEEELCIFESNIVETPFNTIEEAEQEFLKPYFNVKDSPALEKILSRSDP